MENRDTLLALRDRLKPRELDRLERLLAYNCLKSLRGSGPLQSVDLDEVNPLLHPTTPAPATPAPAKPTPALRTSAPAPRATPGKFDGFGDAPLERRDALAALPAELREALTGVSLPSTISPRKAAKLAAIESTLKGRRTFAVSANLVIKP